MKKKFTLLVSLLMIVSLMTIACTNEKENFVAEETVYKDATEAVFVEQVKTIASTEAPTELPTEPEMFSSDISFEYEYIHGDEVMSYGLFTPSTAINGEEKPLIVWLHGMGEFGVDEATFNDANSLPRILRETTFEGFDAYVICPHIAGEWYAPHWFRPWAVDNLKNLLDWFIDEYNIDSSKVMISGHSSGGVGAMYIAHELDGYFSKMAILSGEGVGDKIYNIHIPAKGYVENSGNHYGYMKYIFAPVFGEENLRIYSESHPDIPKVVFMEDLNNNNRADIFEWLLLGEDVVVDTNSASS